MVIEGFIKSSVYLSICSSIHQSIHSFFRIMIVEISDFWSCCDFLQFLPQWLDQAPDRHNGSSGVRAPGVWSRIVTLPRVTGATVLCSQCLLYFLWFLVFVCSMLFRRAFIGQSDALMGLPQPMRGLDDGSVCDDQDWQDVPCPSSQFLSRHEPTRARDLDMI